MATDFQQLEREFAAHLRNPERHAAPAGNGGDATAAPRELTAADLEVAVLDRTRPRRAFRRLGHDEVSDLLGGGRSSKKG